VVEEQMFWKHLCSQEKGFYRSRLS